MFDDNYMTIRAENEYNIASGVTRNNSDNLTRISGFRCPLGTTNQIFKFKFTLNEVKQIFDN
jgi:hypothetical protein